MSVIVVCVRPATIKIIPLDFDIQLTPKVRSEKYLSDLSRVLQVEMTYLTDDVRNTPRDSARIGCGRPDRRAVDASSVGRPSCSPWCRPDCTRRWDLRAERTLHASVG